MNDWHLARGYHFAGIVSHLRSEPNRRDLAVIVSERPAAAVGVFTQNRVFAAPVQLCRERLPRQDARAIVICSGNANACTGEQGLQDAYRMAELVSESVGCNADEVLVASTGIIGRPLPMPILEAGIPQACSAAEASPTAFNDAAHAILTTDTVSKVSTRQIQLASGLVTLTGFAKGAAMIGPNMATMLGFILTDAALPTPAMQEMLRRTTAKTFNCISVEGHTSTNDTVLLLANGEGAHLSGEDLRHFEQALQEVCSELARKIAEDAEGANHLVVLDIEGCRSDEDAHKIAKSIAESALVKTAIYGCDPNWGRIVSAAGYAGVPFDDKQMSLWMGDLLLYRQGVPVPFDEDTASDYLKKNREVHLRLQLQEGHGHCRYYTCDLTLEYVKLNADYTT